MKQALIIAATALGVFLTAAVGVLLLSDDVDQDEGFLYSAIGCTSVYKKLDENEKVETMLNLIHNFSTKQGIEQTQPGYLTRFIKLVEKKWEKEHEVALNKCNGIYQIALRESKPEKYNAVALSVIEYIHDLDSNKKETATEKANRLLKEQGLVQ